MSWRARAGWSAVGLLVSLLGWAVLARGYAPQANSDQVRFDAIIVLGYPADSDGNPSPTQLARVTEGVREYERGIAPRLIMTGGPAHNQFVEANVMAQAAQAEGIPASAILVEPKAEDTIQNACYTLQLMKQHGWHSAEVVSSGYHLARSAMIFDKLPIKWRTHEAPALEPASPTRAFEQSAVETIKTMRYLVYAQWADRCKP